MLPRILEPEVMDTVEEAADYDAMDHRAVNECFVNDWRSAWKTVASEKTEPELLDVGTGTALMPIEFCRQCPTVRITAVDLADEMLKLGRENLRTAGVESRIKLERIDAKSLPYADGQFDSVVSNSIIHHIPTPLASLSEMVRVLAPGGLLFVRDLYRPDSIDEVEAYVTQYAGQESARQKQLFRQSFHAALTVREVADLLEQVGLPRSAVTMTSDRHWTIVAIR